MADRQGVNVVIFGTSENRVTYPYGVIDQTERILMFPEIPLPEAIAEMHRIAERDRAGLIAAGVLTDEDVNHGD